VREAALAVLAGLDEEAVPAGGLIERAESSFGRREDRALFRALIGAVLRHRSRLDAVLDSLLDRLPVAELPLPIRAALRLGAAQLVVLDGIPAHAAVDTSVELAARHGHRGTAGLVNAVLRRLGREGRARWEEWDRFEATDPVETLAVRHSHPVWLVRRWAARWGLAETERVLRWNNAIPDYWLRLKPGATAPPGAADGWISGTARFPAGSHPAEQSGFSAGQWTIQDGSGILVGLLLPEVRGVVLDLCSAPGTKTGHLAERARTGTRLFALDPSRGRLRRLARGLARQGRSPDCAAAVVARTAVRSASVAGASGIGASVAGASVAGASGTGASGIGASAAGANEAGASGTGPVEEASVRILLAVADGRRTPIRPPWDSVLVDAPCSNLGVLRRRVDLKWRAREEEILRLAVLQAELLVAAAAGCAAGGHLVYSVCTMEPEETSEQRDRFFAAHPLWTPAPLPAAIPMEARAREGEMLLPPGKFETDGGYAFLARREESGA
jgi:16S rRNA (cytosine967-C5)-methyltransferase